MTRHMSLFASVLALIAVPFFVHCGGSETNIGGSSANVTKSSPEVDWQFVRDEWDKAETLQDKQQLLLDFLDKHPNSEFSLRAISASVDQYFMDEKKDPEGALVFAQERLVHLMDDKYKADSMKLLIRLYGETGKSEMVQSSVDEFLESMEPGLEDYISFTDSAFKAGNWELAHDLSRRLFDKNTEEKIRADAGERGISDEWLGVLKKKYNVTALMNLGHAAANMGDVVKGSGYFEKAMEYAWINAGGCASWPNRKIFIYWSSDLVKGGDYKGAIDIILPDAAIGGNEEALAILQRAYLADNRDLQNFNSFIKESRLRIAKKVIDFEIPDYEGKEVAWNDLKGRVSLLAFWHPS